MSGRTRPGRIREDVLAELNRVRGQIQLIDQAEAELVRKRNELVLRREALLDELLAIQAAPGPNEGRESS